jgi:hypothetical protein
MADALQSSDKVTCRLTFFTFKRGTILISGEPASLEILDMKTSLRLALPLFLMVSASLWAHGRPSPITPGHYRNWGGQIDKLEILATFKVADYSRIVVQPFDTSPAPLPKEGDSAYAAVQRMASTASSRPRRRRRRFFRCSRGVSFRRVRRG